MARPTLPVIVLALSVVGAACSGTESNAAHSTASETLVQETATPTTSAATTTTIATTTTPTTTTPSELPALGRELNEAMAAWHEDQGELGVVAVVVGPDDFTWTGTAGLADREAGTPVPADGLFEIASITKPMVAAAAVALAETGELDLDASLDDFLPGRGLSAITVRSLLAHTAGLDDIDAAGTFVGSDMPDLARRVEPEDLVDAAAALVPPDPPGRYSYSNAGYWLVGAAIEAATGRSLSEVLRTLVVEPAGMNDTYLAWDEALPRELVTGYFDLFGTGTEVGLGTEPIPAMITGAWAAGGVVASAADVAAFFDALFRGAIVGDVNMMLEGADADHGLGLSKTFFRAGEAWGHNGGIPGYTTSAYHDLATGYSVAVMTNRFGFGGPETETLAGMLLGRIDAAE